MTNTKIEVFHEPILDNGVVVANPIINVSADAIQNKAQLDQFIKTIRVVSDSLWPSESVNVE